MVSGKALAAGPKRNIPFVQTKLNHPLIRPSATFSPKGEKGHGFVFVSICSIFNDHYFAFGLIVFISIQLAFSELWYTRCVAETKSLVSASKTFSTYFCGLRSM